MRVAFLVQLPKGVSPGQRFRIEQYEPTLKSEGFKLDTFCFLGEKTYKVLYRRGYIRQKIVGVCYGFYRRFLFLFKAKNYDYIFLQREASPLGPPIFEWILAKVLRKRLILDFDDAIWIKDSSGSNSFVNVAKCFWKVKCICHWSYKIAVGNQFLANYARQYNDNVVIIPTSVDTKYRYNQPRNQNTQKPVIGWTGSHSTLKYLDLIFPILQRLETDHNFEFLVICNEPPSFYLKSLKFIQWKESREIDDLMKIDIGLMPLDEDVWSEGKCGFKLIQYMALGIPALASPVGVNKTIIEHGVNGYLCQTDAEWIACLTALLQDEQKRSAFGERGRKKIEQEYSVASNAANFISLFSN